MNSLSDVFREEPIPFVIYNNDLRSKYNVILQLVSLEERTEKPLKSESIPYA